MLCYVKVNICPLYSHEHANERCTLCSVLSGRRNDVMPCWLLAESSKLRNQQQQSSVDVADCVCGWNDEVTVCSWVQEVTADDVRNEPTHDGQISGCQVVQTAEDKHT